MTIEISPSPLPNDRNTPIRPPLNRFDHQSSEELEMQKYNLMILASHLWIGGAESVIRHLAESIDKRRFNVIVCCLKQRGSVGEELVMKGTEVISFAETQDEKVDYFTSLKLLRVLRSRKIDIVHTHTTQGLVDASLSLCVFPQFKLIHTFHYGNYPHTLPRIIWMERIFSRFAHRLFAVGEVQRRQIQSVYQIPDRRIGTIYNGVSLQVSDGDPTFRKRVAAENRILIGTIATLIPQKGLQFILDVAKLLQRSGHNAVFVIVGEGLLRAELEGKRAKLGLENMVVFTGWVANAATTALPAFDIFFQPSLWEAMSMVILEAMAASKAIVATKVGENDRILEDGVDGLLVQPKDVAGMADRIGRLIDDAGLRVRLGEAARAKVERQFTIEHMTRAYEMVYSDLMR